MWLTPGVLLLASLKPSALYAFFLGLNRQSINKIGISCHKVNEPIYNTKKLVETSAQDFISVHRIKFDQCSYYKQTSHRYKALNPVIVINIMRFCRIARFMGIKSGLNSRMLGSKSLLIYKFMPDFGKTFRVSSSILYYYG